MDTAATASLTISLGVDMPIPFFKYVKAKDHYCLGYFGYCNEYIVQLSYLRPHIEKQLPGMQIHLACKDDTYHLLKGLSNTIPWSVYKDCKRQFGHIKEIGTDMKAHPVLQLMRESKLQFPAPPPIIETNRRCAVWNTAALPTRCIETAGILGLKRLLVEKGYEPIDQTNDIGCVAGVESEFLYTSAIRGLMTYLVPTGIGTELYREMFPNRSVLEKI